MQQESPLFVYLKITFSFFILCLNLAFVCDMFLGLSLQSIKNMQKKKHKR